MKKRVYVKPVTSKTGAFGWVVLELTVFEDFVDDMKRYGMRVAIFNYFMQLFMKAEVMDDE